MRRLLVTGAMVLALALALQSCNPAENPAAESGGVPTAGGTYSTSGEIITMSDSSVTIDHQPVAALGWPAMTMMYKAPDSSMISGLQTGAAVEFSFRQEGSDYVLTDIKPR
jgi:Cu/Ag efflux protein CusF